MSESRFRSCLSQSDRYMPACYRYTELNPVRAGMAEHPADYPWSSYRFNGLGMANAHLSRHPLYRAPGQSRRGRLRRYRELFREHLEPERIDGIRQATNGNYALGDARIRAEIEATLQRRVTPARAGRRTKD